MYFVLSIGKLNLTRVMELKNREKEPSLTSLEELRMLYRRGDFARGTDVGHHIGSPGWQSKHESRMLSARNEILDSSEHPALSAMLSQLMTREVKDQRINHAYHYDPEVMEVMVLWQKRGVAEKVTGHFYHGLGRLMIQIENVINRMVAEDADRYLIPDFEECKKGIESQCQEWKNQGFPECEPFYQRLLELTDQASKTDQGPDKIAHIVMLLTAMYSDAHDVEGEVGKARENRVSKSS